MLIEALDDVAEGVIFGVLCVLDGVRAIESGPDKGELELYYVKDGTRVLLNTRNNPSCMTSCKECPALIGRIE